ncbi:hypothetical protein D3C87_1606600 [compost metagenome]
MSPYSEYRYSQFSVAVNGVAVCTPVAERGRGAVNLAWKVPERSPLSLVFSTAMVAGSAYSVSAVLGDGTRSRNTDCGKSETTKLPSLVLSLKLSCASK